MPLRRTLLRSHLRRDLAAQSHTAGRRSLRRRLLLLLLTFLLFEKLLQKKWLFLKVYESEVENDIKMLTR